MSYCPTCGAKLEPTDRFCPKCGHAAPTGPAVTPPSAAAASAAPQSAVQQHSAASYTPAPTAPATGKGKGRRIGLIVGGGCLTLLLAAAALVASIYFLTSGPTESAKEHLQYLVRGDVATAYQTSSPALRETISLETYQALVSARPLIQKTRDISIPERQMENSIATVTTQLTDNSGVVRSVPMRLRKEGGEWLVIAIDLSSIPVELPPAGTSAPSGANTATNATAPPATPTTPDMETKPAEGLQPAAPGDKGRGVGSVTFGSGRTESDALINPGTVVPSSIETLSADISLINHPPGGSVQVWIEHIASGNRTAAISATIEGQGSGNLPFDLHLGEDRLVPGKYRLVILLDEDMRFEREFEVK